MISFCLQGEDHTKTAYYCLAALSYLVAMVSSNKALVWVNYPTQVHRICVPGYWYLVPILLYNLGFLQLRAVIGGTVL
jgi:hypothetical protein